MRPEGRWYAPLVVVLCLGFLAVSTLLMISMVSTVIGPFHLDALWTPPGGERVGLWHPASARAFPEFDASERRRVWRALFPRPFDLIESTELSELIERDVGLIVVSDASALGSGEMATLLAHARGGRAVLVSGWIAVRDASGQPRDTRRMARLLAVERVVSVTSDSLSIGSRGPLLVGLGPGDVLPLGAPSAGPAVSGFAELYWSGAPRQGVRAATRRRTVGKGALIWIATMPASESLAPAWPRLYGNASAWARHQPVHELLAWPDGAPCAGLQGREPADLPRVELSLEDGESHSLYRVAESGSREGVAAGALRARGCWIAPAAEISRWWTLRGQVRTDLEAVGERRLLLHVTHEGVEPASRLAVRIHVNRSFGAVHVSSTTLFTATPLVQRGRERLDLRLPELSGGQTLTFAIDFEDRADTGR